MPMFVELNDLCYAAGGVRVLRALRQAAEQIYFTAKQVDLDGKAAGTTTTTSTVDAGKKQLFLDGDLREGRAGARDEFIIA